MSVNETSLKNIHFLISPIVKDTMIVNNNSFIPY